MARTHQGPSHNRTPKSVLNAPKPRVETLDVDRKPSLHRRDDRDARRLDARVLRDATVAERRRLQDANTVISRRRAAAGEFDHLPGVGPSLRVNVQRDLDRIQLDRERRSRLSSIFG